MSAEGGFVYIMASKSRTIYVGETSDLEGRIWEHKYHVSEGFTKKHDVTKLVYFELHASIEDAIAREKSLKVKTRAKKIALIGARNPRWNDLAWNWFDDLIVWQRGSRAAERFARGSFDTRAVARGSG